VTLAGRGCKSGLSWVLPSSCTTLVHLPSEGAAPSLRVVEVRPMYFADPDDEYWRLVDLLGTLAVVGSAVAFVPLPES
jgi:hypothetical protein